MKNRTQGNCLLTLSYSSECSDIINSKLIVLS
jgi:hypothetical protein